MWLYKVINAPALPAELEQKVMALYNSPERDLHLINSNSYANSMKPELAGKLHPKDVTAIKDGRTIRNSRGRRYKLEPEVYDWLHSHLTADYTDAGLSVISGPDATLLPHTDQTRNYAVLYTFEPGGPDVETCYWQEHGYPADRGLREFGTDYSKLDLLHSIKIPLRTWVILNTNVLHSVENCYNDRIQIQMGVNNIPESWTYSTTISL